LGLIDEVIVCKPDALEKYINEKLEGRKLTANR